MATMMILDSYTFTLNPERCDMPLDEKRASVIKTITGAEFFSWGAILAGQTIVLKWSFMPIAMFAQLETINTNDTQVIFNPGTGTNYNVEILAFKGAYFIDQTGSATHRRNVELKLAIMSEV